MFQLNKNKAKSRFARVFGICLLSFFFVFTVPVASSAQGLEDLSVVEELALELEVAAAITLRRCTTAADYQTVYESHQINCWGDVEPFFEPLCMYILHYLARCAYINNPIP